VLCCGVLELFWHTLQSLEFVITLQPTTAQSEL
jgi:hypothetical protein